MLGIRRLKMVFSFFSLGKPKKYMKNSQAGEVYTASVRSREETTLLSIDKELVITPYCGEWG